MIDESKFFERDKNRRNLMRGLFMSYKWIKSKELILNKRLKKFLMENLAFSSTKKCQELLKFKNTLLSL